MVEWTVARRARIVDRSACVVRGFVGGERARRRSGLSRIKRIFGGFSGEDACKAEMAVVRTSVVCSTSRDVRLYLPARLDSESRADAMVVGCGVRGLVAGSVRRAGGPRCGNTGVGKCGRGEEDVLLGAAVEGGSIPVKPSTKAKRPLCASRARSSPLCARQHPRRYEYPER